MKNKLASLLLLSSILGTCGYAMDTELFEIQANQIREIRTRDSQGIQVEFHQGMLPHQASPDLLNDGITHIFVSLHYHAEPKAPVEEEYSSKKRYSDKETDKRVNAEDYARAVESYPKSLERYAIDETARQAGRFINTDLNDLTQLKKISSAFAGLVDVLSLTTVSGSFGELDLKAQTFNELIPMLRPGGKLTFGSGKGNLSISFDSQDIEAKERRNSMFPQHDSEGKATYDHARNLRGLIAGEYFNRSEESLTTGNLAYVGQYDKLNPELMQLVLDSHIEYGNQWLRDFVPAYPCSFTRDGNNVYTITRMS